MQLFLVSLLPLCVSQPTHTGSAHPAEPSVLLSLPNRQKLLQQYGQCSGYMWTDTGFSVAAEAMAEEGLRPVVPNDVITPTELAMLARAGIDVEDALFDGLIACYDSPASELEQITSGLPVHVMDCGYGWFSKTELPNVNAQAICQYAGFDAIDKFGGNDGILCSESTDGFGNCGWEDGEDCGVRVDWHCAGSVLPGSHIWIDVDSMAWASSGPSSTGPSSTGPSSTGPSSTGPSSSGPSSGPCAYR